MNTIDTINIRPGVSILSVLKHLNYKPWFALAEFVDNAIQSYLEHEDELKDLEGPDFKLLVKIEIDPSEDGKITIRDNAAGIYEKDYARAFRPAAVPPDKSGLNEFGMGMKSAACWFADRFVRLAYDARDNDALLRSLESNSPFFSLGQAMRRDLISALEYEDLKRGEVEGLPQLESAYRRLELLTYFMADIFPDRRIGVKGFLESGIITAVDVMSNTLEVIPQVYGRLDEPDELIGIAQRSYQFVTRLASQHVEVAIPTLNMLRKVGFKFGPFNPDYFCLQGEQGHTRLALSDEGERVIEEVVRPRLEQEGDNISPTVGCLALVNFGEGSAIQTLWSWHMELAREIYPRLKPGIKK